MTEIKLVTDEKDKIIVSIEGNFIDLVNVLASAIANDPSFRTIVVTALEVLDQDSNKFPEPINMN
jgi:hypothetical protein